MFDNLNQKFAQALQILRGKSKIDQHHIEEVLGQVRTALLEADVNFQVVKNFIAQVKEKALGEKVLTGVEPEQQFIKIVHQQLSLVMGGTHRQIDLDRPAPIPILVVGLNGQGKTTFSGKFAKLIKKKKKNVLLVPADTFRPAAKEQLQILAQQTQVECYDSDLSLPPAQIAQQAIAQARRDHRDVVLIDTAGRLHVDDQLMSELVALHWALEEWRPEVLLVADAMTGQEAVNVAQTFHKEIGLTGIVLSKMDSDARGGAALSIVQVTGVPISYLSTGEGLGDLEAFHPDRMAGRILDMGDIVSLVEKAEEEVDQKEQEQALKRLEKGRFDLEDFVKQMDTLQKLGPLSGILKMLPGAGGLLRQAGDLGAAEGEMRRMRVIVDSMTKKERSDHTIVKDSHVKRIAKGSGQSTQEVKNFLTRFRQMKKVMTDLLPAMKSGALPSGAGGPFSGGLPSLGLDGGGHKKGKRRSGRGRGPWGKGYF